MTANRRQPRVAVLGAGSWGTTVATIIAAQSPTVLWARSPETAEQVNTMHRNDRYLPDFPLPESLTATSDLYEAVEPADVIVMGVPSHGFRSALEELAPAIRPWTPVVSLVKGLEQVTQRRMTEIIDEVLPGHPAGVLAGPNIAREVVAGYAAAAVIAMPDQHLAAQLGELFRTKFFRIYSTSDVVGVEVAGALKNVFAIAVGMGDGVGSGDNTRAMVITRSLREMTQARRTARRRPRHVRGAGRHGRPHGHLHEPAQPQPARRRGTGQGPADRGDPGRDEAGRRGREVGAGGDEDRRRGRASTCRSPARSTPC